MSEQRAITTDGSERSLKGAVIGKLASDLRGELLTCDHPGYDAARKVWNGMVDKRPALIARCAGTADVISCVRFAREYELLVSVRGGGHHYAGKSVCAGGLMIDLRRSFPLRCVPARCDWFWTRRPSIRHDGRPWFLLPRRSAALRIR